MKESDLKNGKFVDDQGREQLAVPLSSIFGMVGGKKPQNTNKVHSEPHRGKKKPTPINRGIKLPK